MGGADDGQSASHLAAQFFAADCREVTVGWLLSGAFFRNAVANMNNAVFLEVERRQNNMGTTPVLMGFCHERAYVCDVCDSRA